MEEKHLTQLVMGYLRERGHLEALACLHLESGLAEGEVGEELKYLQKLVLQGAWADVFVYLHPLRRTMGHNYEPIEALVKKQQVRSNFLPSRRDAALSCFPSPSVLACLFSHILYHVTFISPSLSLSVSLSFPLSCRRARSTWKPCPSRAQAGAFTPTLPGCLPPPPPPLPPLLRVLAGVGVWAEAAEGRTARAWWSRRE